MKKIIHEKYKAKALKYINSNRKYTNIFSDRDINGIEEDCKNLFSNYNEFLTESNDKYNQLNGASTEFSNGYWEIIIKKKKKEKRKIKNKLKIKN